MLRKTLISERKLDICSNAVSFRKYLSFRETLSGILICVPEICLRYITKDCCYTLQRIRISTSDFSIHSKLRWSVSKMNDLPRNNTWSGVHQNNSHILPHTSSQLNAVAIKLWLANAIGSCIVLPLISIRSCNNTALTTTFKASTLIIPGKSYYEKW